MTPLEEWDFWEGQNQITRFENAFGQPPYHVSDVAWMVLGMLGTHRGAKILDLGCGPGRLAQEVVTRWKSTVAAVDISQSMLRLVELDERISTYLCNGRDIPEVIGKVDAAYSVAMFQHIPHEAQESYIHQVADRLHSGGRFAFTVAMGEVNQFLNHQVTTEQVLGWLHGRLVPLHHNVDGRGWNWFVAAKP